MRSKEFASRPGRMKIPAGVWRRLIDFDGVNPRPERAGGREAIAAFLGGPPRRPDSGGAVMAGALGLPGLRFFMLDIGYKVLADGGEMVLESEQGKGPVFSFALPRADKPPPAWPLTRG